MIVEIVTGFYMPHSYILGCTYETIFIKILVIINLYFLNVCLYRLTSD